MKDVAAEEFAVLRETIRARGTGRPVIFMAGLGTWAVLVVTILIFLANPIASLVPLLVLLGTFETVRALHLGVERIGRYIQVFFEEDANHGVPTAAPAWEHTAMVFGPSIPGAGVHPFFQPMFVLATAVNLLIVWLPGPLIQEALPLLVPHLAFVIWMVYCDRGMRRQRAAELARYRALKASLAGAGDGLAESSSHTR